MSESVDELRLIRTPVVQKREVTAYDVLTMEMRFSSGMFWKRRTFNKDLLINV